MSTYARAEERRRNYIKSLLLVAAKRRARITAPVQLTRLAGYVLHPDAPRMPYITDPTGHTYRLGPSGRLVIESITIASQDEIERMRERI